MERNTVGVIITLALALRAVPLVSDAQQPGKGARIGSLSPVSFGAFHLSFMSSSTQVDLTQHTQCVK